jgi:two-component system sensor histidine kinase and response regulator WspE
MSGANGEEFGGFSLVELYRTELEEQIRVLTAGLLALEEGSSPAEHLESLMRAAHSIKGAARIVDHGGAVRVAHALEDFFVAAQADAIVLSRTRLDACLAGVDLLSRSGQAQDADLSLWAETHDAEISRWSETLWESRNERADLVAVPLAEPGTVEPSPAFPSLLPDDAQSRAVSPVLATATPPEEPGRNGSGPAMGDRVVRVNADNLTRLLDLSGEVLLASRWIEEFSSDMLRLKRLQNELGRSIEGLRESLLTSGAEEALLGRMEDLRRHAGHCREALLERISDLDGFDRRSVHLSHRLYQGVLDCRMRPFSDGTQAFPRMVRDVARQLGKDARLELFGESTTVDREILQRLEAPLTHLLRNAVDHGLETPAERAAAGKPATGLVRLEARHHSGMLLITVGTDGPPPDLARMRRVIEERQLAPSEMVSRLSESELLEFLFLPGFSSKQEVTEISGRGVGLDVVQSMVKEVGGTARLLAPAGHALQVQLNLPLTLSVVRTLLVEIAGEPYAFPLARTTGVVKLSREAVRSVEGRQYFRFREHETGLVSSRQLLELAEVPGDAQALSVVVISERGASYGLVVDRLLGEQELVVHSLDPRLGKIPNISAAALLPDRSPVLLFDVDDLTRSIVNLATGTRLAAVDTPDAAETGERPRRVLVVDDSLTVRELERKLLLSRGYQVETAVDGMEGWNSVRTGGFDLIITDVDMPRMDGIELVSLIRKDPRLASLPVMIVSYKDREEDRRRGLEAGADYYLTKGSFQDDTLVKAVADLIGEPAR